MNKSFSQNSVLVLVLLIVLLALSLGTTWLSGNDLGSFGIVLVGGLFNAMLLFLVASGLSIVFGLMDVLNLAQGAYFTVGAYVAWQVHHSLVATGFDPNLSFFLAVVVATLVGGIMGIILERGLLRPLYSRPIFQIVLTFGVGIVIGEIVKVLWGTAALQWTASFALNESSFTIFEQQFSIYRLFVIGMGFGLIIAIALLLRYTRIGIIIRAGVEDAGMVEALGIDVRFVFTAIFTLGCAIAALGGAVAAPFLGASLGVGQGFLLGAIAVVVLGGMGSYEGTAVGSILVGLAQQVVVQISQYATTVNLSDANFMGINFAPFLNGTSDILSMTAWSSMTPMILLVLVLLLRPAGLFGKDK